MRTWVLAVAAMLAACASEKVVPPRPVLATSRTTPTPPPTIPRDLLGWFESGRCVRALAPSDEHVAVRIAEGRVDLIFSGASLETGMVKLEPSEQDEWNAVSAAYEIGRAAWMVDGFVIVDGPRVAPSTARRYARRDLKTLSRRITLAEGADGWVLSLSSANHTGDHSRYASLRCLVGPVPKEEVSRLDDLVVLLSGPRTCEVATSCCRAIRAAGAGDEEEDSNDFCDGAPGLMPQFCLGWLDRAIDAYRFPRVVCKPRPDGGSSCSIVLRAEKGRPTLPECVAPDIGLSAR